METARTDGPFEVFCCKGIERSEAVAGGETELREVFPQLKGRTGPSLQGHGKVTVCKRLHCFWVNEILLLGLFSLWLGPALG